MSEAYIESKDSNQIKISSDVVASIANLAANKVEGVVAIADTLAGGMAQRLGMKNDVKGTKVECTNEECSVEVPVTLAYGVNFVSVCQEVQKNVKKSIEMMTGLRVTRIDVLVSGIQMGPAKMPEKK